MGIVGIFSNSNTSDNGAKGIVNTINASIDTSLNDLAATSATSATVSSNTITINGGGGGGGYGYSSYGGGYANSGTISTISTIDSSYINAGYVSLTDEFLSKDSAEKNLSILENLLKTNILASKLFEFDRELEEGEFLDLVKLYVTRETKKECDVKFIKDIMSEIINVTFNPDNISFSLSNVKELQPEVFLYHNKKFYLNTDKLTNLIKRAAFNRLLNV